MNKLSKIKKILGASIAMILCADASAYTVSTNTGLVATILTVGSGGGAPGNQDFRITLQGIATQCNGNAVSYINTSDANYNVIVANVLTARAIGAPISLYTTPDTTGAGCHILFTTL